MRIGLLSISARISIVEFLVFMSTLVFQLSIGGWKVHAEVSSVILYLHFNRDVPNSQSKPVATCIGPFHIDKNPNRPCGYHYKNVSPCIYCYPYGCNQLSESTNVTKAFNVRKENLNLEKVLETNGTLYLDIGVLTCELVLPKYLQKYSRPCEVFGPNHPNLHCQYKSETQPTTYPITWPTTPIAIPPNVSYSTPKVGVSGHEDNSATNLDEGSQKSEPSNNYIIIWISVAAAAIVFTFVGCAILFTQRSKIMKCLGSKNNRDVLDNAFLYRDMSMSRRQNQLAPQNALYENIIPIVFHKETIYAELDLAPNNVNQEGEAAEANFPVRQSHDVVNQENSVIYAELQKC
ncbi:hypothetical protein GHT06_014293 [Daphnia sinensis]|uniref:Uncharacterized protein n=1 Tax=Daphnia sinensis TaxID=1820382 RepID=A0AAD5PW24_9CRUS|nr:hypothetical protein GHT06_014293 [Daphnia sinensis]